MRLVPLVLSAAALVPAGCSCLAAAVGKDVESLTTREQVRAEFGSPLTSGDEAGRPCDEYLTRRKIAERLRASGLGVGIVMTGGFGGLLFFPNETYRIGRGLISGRRLRFNYDEAGGVRSITLDDDPLLAISTPAAPAPVVRGHEPEVAAPVGHTTRSAARAGRLPR